MTKTIRMILESLPTHSDNAFSARVVGNLVLNFLLLPAYILLIILCLALSVSPLFPARTARENFKNRLGMGTVVRVFSTTAVLFHYILLVIEDFVFFPLQLVSIRNNEGVRREMSNAASSAKEKSVGIAILSAHFGNVEVAAQAAKSIFTPQVSQERKIIALAKPSRFAWATQILGWYRAKRGLEIILTNRKDLIKAILTAIKNERVIALLIDQKPAKDGFFIDFFGTPSAFPEGGVELALRMNTTIVFFAARRLWPGRYTFEGQWYLPPSDDTQQTKISSLFIAYVDWLEALIRRSPCQWCWDYRKWSRQPRPQSLG